MKITWLASPESFLNLRISLSSGHYLTVSRELGFIRSELFFVRERMKK